MPLRHLWRTSICCCQSCLGSGLKGGYVLRSCFFFISHPLRQQQIVYAQVLLDDQRWQTKIQHGSKSKDMKNKSMKRRYMLSVLKSWQKIPCHIHAANTLQWLLYFNYFNDVTMGEYGRTSGARTLHVACLGGIIEVINASLLRIIYEALNRYNHFCSSCKWLSC